MELEVAECVEKVEAMVTTAILHQEDVLEMLKNLSYRDPDRSPAVASHIVATMKEKLESAMDWCRLAQCRLKALIPEGTGAVR
uniref:Uncharacterized protein n=1 Tax=Physcomitrium patens TaxID=3218 RepID=A0A2K1KI76_PHYPA|nr:hypothetical protein PHYPA_007155 [Physcomitrium patens]